MASDTRPTKKDGIAREKVALKPGFHLMDWMRLCQTSSNLSGNKDSGLRKITTSELAEHSSQFDCWTAYNGKVYNITQYLPYHPGGDKKLMLGAGKDSTDLFNRYHKWVNMEQIMGKTFVGVLINEVETIKEDEEEEDDSTNMKKPSTTDL